MFKTARFKVHNPSRHKSTILWYAMTRYHETLKDLLEKTLAIPDLLEQVSELDKKEKLRPNKYKLSKLLYTIAPHNWELSPLRDYLINDASAMLMSHLNKAYKGENESNPPTVSSLNAMTEEEFQKAYNEFTNPEAKLTIKSQQQEKIDNAAKHGKTHVAKRLSKIYANWAVSRAAGQVLRKLEGTLPHPIEFTRNEFARGCLLAYCDGNYYLLIRLFTQDHRYCEKHILKEGFINCKTQERLDGKKYPGLILPLELGREFHEQEYLTYGSIQSAKLIVKRRERLTSVAKAHVHPTESNARDKSPAYHSASFNAEDYDFYVHAAFEFTPPSIETETFLGIDRGAAKIGVATLIDQLDAHETFRPGRLILCSGDAAIRTANQTSTEKRQTAFTQIFATRQARRHHSGRICQPNRGHRQTIPLPNCHRGHSRRDDGTFPEAKPVRQTEADAHLQSRAGGPACPGRSSCSIYLADLRTVRPQRPSKSAQERCGRKSYSRCVFMRSLRPQSQRRFQCEPDYCLAWAASDRKWW